MILLVGLVVSCFCALLKLVAVLAWTWKGVAAPAVIAMLLEALWRGDILGWLIADDFLDSLSSHDFHDD